MHCTQNRSDANIWAAARSRHPTGLNVVMADGAVGFVSNSIEHRRLAGVGNHLGQ